MVGKLPPAVLSGAIYGRTGVNDPAVRQGPAYGEDTAAIEVDAGTLVVNADPLSLAADRVGTLAVHEACNDVAASGARPRWLTNTMFLPGDDPGTVEDITTQLDAACRDLGVSIVGGHAEYFPTLERPLLTLSAMGITQQYVPTAGAQSGERVLLLGSAGIEGTAILATDFRGELAERGVDERTIERAATFADALSVVTEALAVRASASGMHDPTEGGVLAGLYELAAASEVGIAIARDEVPIRSETRALASAMEVDPLRMFGSGALIATVSPSSVDAVRDAVDGAAVAEIGTVTDDAPGVILDGRRISEVPEEALYDLWT